MYRLEVYSQDDLVGGPERKELLERYNVRTGRCANEDELLLKMRAYNYAFDMLLMDTTTEDENFDLIRDILSNNSSMKLLFITDKVDNLTSISSTGPAYVLPRDFDEEKLYAAIEYVVGKIDQVKKHFLQVAYRGRLFRFPYSQILYIESDKRYSIIHMGWEEQRVLVKLSDLESRLPEEFARCHQSFIVNLSQLKSFDRNYIFLQNGQKIPVSRSREEETRKRVEELFGDG